MEALVEAAVLTLLRTMLLLVSLPAISFQSRLEPVLVLRLISKVVSALRWGEAARLAGPRQAAPEMELQAALMVPMVALTAAQMVERAVGAELEQRLLVAQVERAVLVQRRLRFRVAMEILVMFTVLVGVVEAVALVALHSELRAVLVEVARKAKLLSLILRIWEDLQVASILR